MRASPVSWLHALALLDSPRSGDSLPATATCPLCSGTLTVWEDGAEASEWATCYGCGFSGDMLQMLSAAWQLSPTATINRLVNSGVHVLATPDYLDRELPARQRLHDLWLDASERPLHSSTDLAELISKFGLDSLSRTLPGRGPRQLFGWSDRARIEHAFRERGAFDWQPGSVFLGRSWTDALLVPFWSPPGKLTGFLIAGRQGRPDDVFFKPVGHVGNGRAEVEAGLSLPADAVEAAARRGWMLATNRAFLSLRLQAEAYRATGETLPIAVWQQVDRRGRVPACQTRYGWACAQGSPLVFWGPSGEYPVVRQAIDRNAGLCLFSKRDGESWKTTVREMRPNAFLDLLGTNTRPWPESLALAAIEDTLPIETWLRLELSLAEREAIRSAGGPEALAAIDQKISVPNSPRSVVIQGMQISEIDGALYLDRKSRTELLVDASLRVRELGWSSRTKQEWLRGEVLYRGLELPFCAPRAEIEKDTFRWLRQMLLDAGHGCLHGDSPAGRFILPAALRLHPPEVTTVVDAPGWDSRTATLRLPRWTLETGGKTTPVRFAMPVETPGWKVLRPEPQDKSSLTAEFSAIGVSPLCCLLAALTEQLLSEAVGRAPQSIALVGELSISAARTMQKAFTFPTEESAPNDWPILHLDHRPPPRPILGTAWMTSSRWLACWLSDGKHWRALEGPSDRDSVQTDEAAISRLGAFYWQDLAERNWEVYGDSAIRDLEKFAKSFGCDELVRKSGEMFWPGTDQLGKLLCDIAQSSHRFVTVTGDLAVLSRTRLYREFRALGLPRPHPDVIGARLERLGGLCGSDKASWSLRRDWWESQFVAAPRLKLVQDG